MNISEFNLEIDSQIFLRHYSNAKPIKTLVKNVCFDFILLHSTAETFGMSFEVGDPASFELVKDSQSFIIAATVSEVIPKEKAILLKVEEINDSDQVKENSLIPVSVYADLIINHKKRLSVIIKEMNHKDVVFSTTTEILGVELIDIEMHFNEKVIFAKGTVYRKFREYTAVKCVARMVYMNSGDESFVKNYVNKLMAW